MKILLIELDFMKLFKVELIHGITIFSYHTVALLLYIIYHYNEDDFRFQIFLCTKLSNSMGHINIELTKEAANLPLLFICNCKKVC